MSRYNIYTGERLADFPIPGDSIERPDGLAAATPDALVIAGYDDERVSYVSVLNPSVVWSYDLSYAPGSPAVDGYGRVWVPGFSSYDLTVFNAQGKKHRNLSLLYLEQPSFLYYLQGEVILVTAINGITTDSAAADVSVRGDQLVVASRAFSSDTGGGTVILQVKW